MSTSRLPTFDSLSKLNDIQILISLSNLEGARGSGGMDLGLADLSEIRH
jgi:hypothetical protein